MCRIYAQHVDEGPKLEQLMNELRSEFSSNPPMSGAYTAKRGDLCAAKFEADDEVMFLVTVHGMHHAASTCLLSVVPRQGGKD